MQFSEEAFRGNSAKHIFLKYPKQRNLVDGQNGIFIGVEDWLSPPNKQFLLPTIDMKYTIYRPM